MGDHNERACRDCGSLLHHEDDCLTIAKPVQACGCGAPLPEHLAGYITRHFCSCGRKWRVEKARTDDAHFVEDAPR